MCKLMLDYIKPGLTPFDFGLKGNPIKLCFQHTINIFSAVYKFHRNRDFGYWTKN